MRVYELYRIDELAPAARQKALDKVREYILNSRETCDFDNMLDDYFYNVLRMPRVEYSYRLDYSQGDHFQIAVRLEFSDIFRLADLLGITLGYLSPKEKMTLEFYSDEGCTVDVRVGRYNGYNAGQHWDDDDVFGRIVDDLEQHNIRDINYDRLNTFSNMAMSVIDELERRCMQWGHDYFWEVDEDELLDVIHCENIEFLENGTIF